MPKYMDLIEQRFSRLVVKARVENKGTKAAWICDCDCGSTTVVVSCALKSGKTRSCGCLQREKQSARVTKRNTIHGHNKAGTGNQSRTWTSWSSMKKRCTMQSHISYPDYGGRGISFCERWETFTNFLADMGERPEGKTLDRIDVNGNYEPNNCRWATLSEQQQNKRKKSRV